MHGPLGLVEESNRSVLHRNLRGSFGIDQQFVSTQPVVAGALSRRKICSGAEIGPVDSGFCQTDVELLSACLADMACGKQEDNSSLQGLSCRQCRAPLALRPHRQPAVEHRFVRDCASATTQLPALPVAPNIVIFMIMYSLIVG